MADKYWSIALVQQDGDLQRRIIACASKEGIPDPEYWTMSHSWDYASQPGWGEKYQYAMDTANPSPGKDDAVITDADILTTVQLLKTEDPVPE